MHAAHFFGFGEKFRIIIQPQQSVSKEQICVVQKPNDYLFNNNWSHAHIQIVYILR